jgi:hypothetical protein
MVETGVKGLALAVALLALPTTARAQALTLNCQLESSYDPKTEIETPMSGGFSAIVRTSDGQTSIEATTTGGCSEYVGFVNEQEIGGWCNGSVEFEPNSLLAINRATGQFSLLFYGVGMTARGYGGHCVPAK